MSSNNYSVALYYNQDSEQDEWGVFCATSQVWYFPVINSEAAAIDLARRLNLEAV